MLRLGQDPRCRQVAEPVARAWVGNLLISESLPLEAICPDKRGKRRRMRTVLSTKFATGEFGRRSGVTIRLRGRCTMSQFPDPIGKAISGRTAIRSRSMT